MSKIQTQQNCAKSRNRNSPSIVTEEVPCNLCGATSYKRLATEKYQLLNATVDLGINRCLSCDLVYVSPRLTPASTQLVYQHDSEHTISNNYCWDGSNSASRFAPLLDRLTQLAKPGLLLDVGCGGGHLLKEAKKAAQWDVIGIEPNESTAEQAQRYANCRVDACFLEDAGFDKNSFDVICMLGVLEHLHDPIGTLRNVRRLLKPDGTLAIYVPNFNYLRLKDAGFLSYLRTGKWSNLSPQEHLFQFTPTTLTNLLDSAGFSTLRVDIGRPFSHGNLLRRMVKQTAFATVKLLRLTTAIHIGGLELIAKPAITQNGAAQ